MRLSEKQVREFASNCNMFLNGYYEQYQLTGNGGRDRHFVGSLRECYSYLQGYSKGVSDAKDHSSQVVQVQ